MTERTDTTMRPSVTRLPAPSSPAWRLQRRLTVAHTHKVNLDKIIWSHLIIFLVSLELFINMENGSHRKAGEGMQVEDGNGRQRVDKKVMN